MAAKREAALRPNLKLACFMVGLLALLVLGLMPLSKFSLIEALKRAF
jgi:hypothetical protein